jgi:hypothetical protein
MTMKRDLSFTPLNLQKVAFDAKKKNGQQLDRSHCPFRGGMNETYKRIDPVEDSMFKLEGLQLGNQGLHKVSFELNPLVKPVSHYGCIVFVLEF